MSRTGTTARQKLDAKIKAMPTGMMMQALDTLGAKTRDEAEGIVYVSMTGEYRRRITALAKTTTTEALLKDWADLEKLDYGTLPHTKSTLYWVIDDQMIQRFPKAAEAMDEIIEGYDGRTEPEVSYSARFMALIEELKA